MIFFLLQCPSKVDDYYSHQLIPLTEPSCPPIQSSTTHHNCHSSPDHQYECIPEYLLTMKHHHPSSFPYATFSRSLIRSQQVPMTNSSQCTCSPLYSTQLHPEESSTPLITNDQSQTKSMILGWTKRENPSSSSHEQRHSFLSQLRKSSLFK